MLVHPKFGGTNILQKEKKWKLRKRKEINGARKEKKKHMVQIKFGVALTLYTWQECKYG